MNRLWFTLLLSKNERFAQKFCMFWQFFTAFPLLCSHRSSLHLFFLKSDRSALLLSLLQKSNNEKIAPIALSKRATVSVSLPSLFKKEWQEWFALFPRANRYLALLLTKNEWFARKTKERIPNPVICINFRINTALSCFLNTKFYRKLKMWRDGIV